MTPSSLKKLFTAPLITISVFANVSISKIKKDCSLNFAHFKITLQIQKPTSPTFTLQKNKNPNYCPALTQRT